MKKVSRKVFAKSVFRGSLLALIHDLKSALFNLKATFIHVFNYYRPNKSLVNVNKIHFGCGNDNKDGYLNIDLARKADIFFDARNALPFQDEQIERMYSSHFLEHLTNYELIAHLKESHRILKKGGCYRICLPDFRGAIDSYLGDDEERFKNTQQHYPLKNYILPNEYVTKLDFLDRALHEKGMHKIYIDYPRLLNILVFCGFDKNGVELSQYDPVIDNQWRKDYSIYINAIK